MDVKLFTTMLSDKDFCDLKKLQYKYSVEAVAEMLTIMKDSMLTELPLLDFAGKNICYLQSAVSADFSAFRLLLDGSGNGEEPSVGTTENEIQSTLEIENIDSSRESIRKIIKGSAPESKNEKYIYGIKQGLDFIGNINNKITEKNLHELYQLSIGNYLDDDEKLLPGNYYRHDSVYVVGGSSIEHEGLPHKKLPDYMGKLIEFINTESKADDLTKAALIHFYIVYLHPYFDGNGRTARLLHLWFLIQRDCSSTLFYPFSSYINATKKSYYKTIGLIESNEMISGMIDATPFLQYFSNEIYNKIKDKPQRREPLKAYSKLLESGEITEKENALWNFVLREYGMNVFSTKQLEKDFGNAAYATIRSFVMKLEKHGLLKKQMYGNRPKYRISE